MLTLLSSLGRISAKTLLVRGEAILKVRPSTGTNKLEKLDWLQAQHMYVAGLSESDRLLS